MPAKLGRLAILVAVLIMPGEGSAIEISTVLMESTFVISAPGSTGTSFIVGHRESPQEPFGKFTLITAAHVLEQMTGSEAVLHLRRKDNNGDWIRRTYAMVIRDGTKNLWVRHPREDIAAMYVKLPKDVVFPNLDSSDFLASDNDLESIGLHPGDEVLCLGFPVGRAANDAGFPVLRSGRIASYPILPTNKTRSFLMDANIWPGNSGGPVYYSYSSRFIDGVTVQRAGGHQQILGMVVQSGLFSKQMDTLTGPRIESYSSGLAVIVHSSFIRETIGLLPRE